MCVKTLQAGIDHIIDSIDEIKVMLESIIEKESEKEESKKSLN